MTVYLTLDQVLELHADGIRRYGGDPGIRDLGLVESAVSQPRMSFARQELYPTLAEKAAALGFSLILNHGFLDGNKRIGFAAIEAFLRPNGHRISTSIDDAERAILAVASSEWTREQFADWVREHIVAL